MSRSDYAAAIAHARAAAAIGTDIADAPEALRFGNHDALVCGDSMAAVALTFAGEALYFWLHRGIDPARVLLANLTLVGGLRPGCIVLAAACTVALIALLRRDRGATGQRRAALATAAE